MYTVAKQFIIALHLCRYVNGLQFFGWEIHNFLAPHTNDVMMVGCGRIVSDGLVKRRQPRDDAVSLERVERLVDCRMRDGGMAQSDQTKHGVRTWMRLISHEDTVYG